MAAIGQVQSSRLQLVRVKQHGVFAEFCKGNKFTGYQDIATAFSSVVLDEIHDQNRTCACVKGNGGVLNWLYQAEPISSTKNGG